MVSLALNQSLIHHTGTIPSLNLTATAILVW